MKFDKENKNSKWYDVIMLEMESMQAYKVFKSGIKQFLTNTKKVMNPPKRYYKIIVHLVNLDIDMTCARMSYLPRVIAHCS